MSINLLEELILITGRKNVLENELLSRHTTFKIGGPAKLYCRPENKDQLIKIINLLRENNEKYFIIGNGSNILCKDEGYNGVVVELGDLYKDFTIEDTTCFASSGARLSTLAKAFAQNNLSGFEFAGGIPGTLGGAVYMNAGAYGGEMKDIITYVQVIDEKGNIKEIKACDMNFGYRTSIAALNNYIILGAKLKLEKGNNKDIVDKMQDFNKRRRDKQPLEYPSAGSTFKRPEGFFAGKLIEDAGLKGYTVGGAMVSTKHSGFVINYNNATFNDVYNLIEAVKKIVYNKFNVRLEEEVKILE